MTWATVRSMNQTSSQSTTTKVPTPDHVSGVFLPPFPEGAGNWLGHVQVGG